MNIIVNKNSNTNKVETKVFELGQITTTLQDLLDDSRIIVTENQIIILSIVDVDDVVHKYLLPIDYKGTGIYGLGKDITEDDLIELGGDVNSTLEYNALLTQELVLLSSGSLIEGNQYQIVNYVAGDDFINVGASDNDSTIIFTATGTTPTVWTNESELLDYSASAPQAIEMTNNTLTGLTYDFEEDGIFNIYSDELFTLNKTFVFIGNNVNSATSSFSIRTNQVDDSKITLRTSLADGTDDINFVLNNTPIKIQIFN